MSQISGGFFKVDDLVIALNLMVENKHVVLGEATGQISVLSLPDEEKYYLGVRDGEWKIIKKETMEIKLPNSEKA
jgi:hypothetical protein